MKRINNIQKFIVATISSITTGYLINTLSGNLKDSNFIVFLALVFTIIFIGIVNYFTESLIDKSKWLRKLLLGKDFIEGYWYDVTIEKDKSSIKWGAMSHIFFENGEIKISGIGYYPSGDKVSVFRSTYSTYDNRVLFCEYKSYTEAVPNFIEYGISQYLFETPPNSYTGFYLDYTNSLRFLIHGKKVSKDELKKFNYFSSEKDQKMFLVEKMKVFPDN